MRNAKKTLSLVMIAIFTTFIVLSGLPAGAVTTAQAKAQVTKATAAVVKVEKTVKVATFNPTTAKTQVTAASKEVAKVNKLGKAYKATYLKLVARYQVVNKKIAARIVAINALKNKDFTDAEAAVIAAEKATDGDTVDLVADEAALANAQGTVTAALELIVKLDQNSSNYKGLMARIDAANSLIVKAMDEIAAIQAEKDKEAAAAAAAAAAAKAEEAAVAAAETAVAAVEKAPLVTAADITAAQALGTTAATAVAAVKTTEKAAAFTARLKVVYDNGLKALETLKPATVASVSAAAGKLTINFNKKPVTTPALTDFVVTKAIGTAAATGVTPTAVTVVSDTAVALTVPVVETAVADQSVVYSVTYGTGTAVAAAAMTVEKLAIDTLTATGVKTVKATFKNAVDTTKAVLVLKNGNVIVNTTTTWNDAKTEATLTGSVAFAVGEYTLSVTGLTTDAITKSVVVAPERVETIKVAAAGYRVTGDATQATIAYTVLNQYGEDITANTVNTNFTVTTSVGAASATDEGVITNTGLAADTATVTVVVVDKTYGKTTTAAVALSAAKALSEITLSAPVLKTGKTKLYSAVNDYKVPFTAKDQYGNAVTTLDLTKITFISSNTTVLNPATGITANTDVDADSKNDLAFDFGTFEGSKDVTVTAIVNATGKSSAITFTVYGTATADVPTLTAPTTRFGVGDSAYKVQLSIKDQYGSEMTATAIKALADANSLTITAGNTSVFTLNAAKVAVSNDKAYVQLDAAALGTANLTVTVNATGKATTVPVTVVAAKYAASMTLVPNYTYAVKDGVVTLKATFKDQYGEALTTSTSVVRLNADTTSFGAIVNVDKTVTEMVANGVTFAAVAWDSSAKLTAELVNAAAWDATKVVDTKTVTFTSVKSDAALTYSVASLGTLATAGAGTTTSPYAKTVSVTAVDASGNKVALASQASLIQNVTTISSALVVNVSTLKVVATGTDDADAVVNVLVNTNAGLQLIAAPVKVAKAAPVAKTLAALDADDAAVTKATATHGTTLNLTTNTAFRFVVTDQYDTTALTTSAVTIFITNANGTITKVTDPTSVAIGGAAADVITITAVTSNGLTKAVEVTLN